MESMLIKGGLILAGTVLMVSSFWMNAYKKITVNFAVIWELLGLMLVLRDHSGIFPVDQAAFFRNRSGVFLCRRDLSV